MFPGARPFRSDVGMLHDGRSFGRNQTGFGGHRYSLDSGHGYPPLGMHSGGLYGSTLSALKMRDIGFDTSSKDPQLMRARVFVGNVNTNNVSREDIIGLFSNYGVLLGVTVFKGYAFIQYADASEADRSIKVLNGYAWNGSALDVKLAVTGMKSQDVSSTVSSANGVKRNAESDNWASDKVKKERSDELISVKATDAVLSESNRAADLMEDGNLYRYGMYDTLICGACRFVTNDFERFREHRKAPCLTCCKPGTEEGAVWQCSVCDEVCESGGSLLEHAQDRHSVRILKNSDQMD